VILDTNVFVEALISAHGAPGTIYWAGRAARFELVTSVVQLNELRRVSRYPKLRGILPAHRVGTLINNLQRAAVLDVLPMLPDHLAAHDPDDTVLLAMALACEADWLVTGDRRAGLVKRGNVGRTRIVPPTAFCADVLPSR
jgi:putative PIN family toxin of toxin-antitoxin system